MSEEVVVETDERIETDSQETTRKRIADSLREVVKEIEEGRCDMYAIAFGARCDKPSCEERHLCMLVQSAVSTPEQEIWLIGATGLLADWAVEDYRKRMAREAMQPIVDAMLKARAAAEAEGATKQ